MLRFAPIRSWTTAALASLLLAGVSPTAAQDLPVQAPAPGPTPDPERSRPMPGEPEPTSSPAGDAEPPAHYLVPPPPPGSRYPVGAMGGGFTSDPEDNDLRIPSRISTRLRVLSTDLDALSARGGSSMASGVLSIVSGGLSITLGLLFDDPTFSVFFYVFGSAQVARGTIDLILAPDPYTPALEFTHMPMRDIHEVKLRLRHGETSLETLADRTRTSRILDGSISIAAGVAIVPLALAPNDFEFKQAVDYFVVIGAGISVLSGVISLVTRTDAERRWEAYRQLRARLRRDQKRAPQPPARLKAGFYPTPGGGLFALRGSFGLL